MKKSLFLSFAISLFGIGMMVVSAQAVEVSTTAVFDGELIKGTSYDTVYYLAEDGKRYVFPNSKTYFSWFEDFSTVREVSDEELFLYPLGGNVRYKPGSLLVKITTDPRVYAVSENGRLRWVKNEEVAKALYGDNWNKLVDDVPDAFFTNYEVGDEINDESGYDPTEIESEYPTISHNRGFRVKETIRNRVENLKERQCARLEDAVNKLQRRAEMYGMEIPGVGDDFISQCIESNQVQKRDKIQVCQMSADGQYKTIEVAPAAVRGMLQKRATLGECTMEADDDASPTDDVIDESDDSSASSSDEMMDESDDSSASSSDEMMDESEDSSATSTDDVMDDSGDNSDASSTDDMV